MKVLNIVAKAIAAALGVAYALYQTARGVGSPGGEVVLADEWVGIGVNALTTGLLVYLVPNKAAAGEAAEKSSS